MKLPFDVLCQEIRKTVDRESRAEKVALSVYDENGKPRYWAQSLAVITSSGWTEKEYFEAIARKDMYSFLCERISDIAEHEPVSEYWPKAIALLASYGWTEEQYWEAVAGEQKRVVASRMEAHQMVEENRAIREYNVRSLIFIAIFFVAWMVGWASFFSFLFY